MTLAWPEMTYTRFGSKTLRHFGVPDQDVIGLQPGRDQVIGVEVKKFQSIQENMSVTISYFIQNLLKCSFLRFWQS
jgi:hypothetical protein